jgi:hypothetical protein
VSWDTSASWQQPQWQQPAGEYAGFFVEASSYLTNEHDHSLLNYEVLNSQVKEKVDCVNVPMIDVRNNPTYAFLDLGCTNFLGSRQAVERFIKAVQGTGITTEILKSDSAFKFASSQSSTCKEKCRVWFPTTPDPVYTEFDIVDEGDVPLLFSLVQMRNMRFEFELTPEAAYLESIGLHPRKI